MRWFRFAVLVLAVAIVQKGVFEGFHTKPDLLLVLLVFFGVCCSTSDAIITSFTLGFAADLVGSPMPMGSHTIAFGVLGTLLAYLHRVITIRRIPHQAVAIIAVSVLTGAATYLLARMSISSSLFWDLIRTAVCSAVVGPFLLPALAWLMHMNISRPRRR